MSNRIEKFDLHIHSKFSFDSLLSPARIIATSLKRGLTGIAIVDHDTIEGGRVACRLNWTNLTIIVGSEIKTEVGDLVGLFLTKEIKSRKSMEVVREIKEQGGIVVIPHPYKAHRLTEEILEQADLVEAINGRVSMLSNFKAQQLAKIRNLPAIAGSDAHFSFEIGRAITKFYMEEAPLYRDLKEKLLKQSRRNSGRHRVLCYEIASQVLKRIKQLQ